MRAATSSRPSALRQCKLVTRSHSTASEQTTALPAPSAFASRAVEQSQLSHSRPERILDHPAPALRPRQYANRAWRPSSHEVQPRKAGFKDHHCRSWLRPRRKLFSADVVLRGSRALGTVVPGPSVGIGAQIISPHLRDPAPPQHRLEKGRGDAGVKRQGMG